jgi:hypothetical protein
MSKLPCLNEGCPIADLFNMLAEDYQDCRCRKGFAINDHCGLSEIDANDLWEIAGTTSRAGKLIVKTISEKIDLEIKSSKTTKSEQKT